jgi:hypothetical protein
MKREEEKKRRACSLFFLMVLEREQEPSSRLVQRKHCMSSLKRDSVRVTRNWQHGSRSKGYDVTSAESIGVKTILGFP